MRSARRRARRRAPAHARTTTMTGRTPRITWTPMNKITIYTTPSEFCARITRLLDAHNLDYSLVTLETTTSAPNWRSEPRAD
jgi:hypothetical protein